MTKRTWWLLGAALMLALMGAGLLLGAGRRFVDGDQTALDQTHLLAVEPDSPIGQTFVAQHGGLCGIEFYLVPSGSAPLSLTLHLREDARSAKDLSTTTLSLPAKAGPDFYRFDLPAVRGSHAQYYYAFLETTAGVKVGAAGGAAYIDGAAHQAHRPLDAQTTFRLVYAPGLVLLDLAGAALSWIPLLLLAALLFVVPGWALLVWALAGRPQPWPVMLGLAVGLSVALYPALLLWAHVFDLNPGSASAWLPVALGVALLLWQARRLRPRHIRDVVQTWRRSAALWPDLTLILVLVLVFAVRLLVVRTAEAPLWGDSYEHTVMAQLMLDRGGLFDLWQPYTPYQSLTVHFGFPAAAAVLGWATGQNGTEAVLLTGQLMNGFAALTLYPLAVRIAGGNRWAGIGAVLVAGTLSKMPAYYVNWGRFAQLAGQVVLPVALWLLWEAVETRKSPWRIAATAGFALCGMALAYYRMPFYYATFVAAWLVGWGLPQWKSDARSWLRGLARLLPIGATAILLLLPLAFRLAGGQLAHGLGGGMTRTAPVSGVLQDYQSWLSIQFYVTKPLLVGAALALLLGLVRRSWMVVAVGFWVLILAALPAGRLIRLPGANYMQTFAILIALYIPTSLLIGWLAGEVGTLLGRSGGRHALALIIVAIAVCGAVGQARIVERGRILVTRPDVRAMDWIRENTPEDSLFLVEGYFYGGFSATGSDAGWWIPILAGRDTNMPPQYALLSEVPIEPGYSKAVVDLVVQLGKVSPGAADGIRLLCDWGFTHVYIGQQQGEVGHEATRLFSEQDLAAGSAFRQVYKQDRVSIYALDPLACESVD
jgi:hypothetical protein